MGSVPFCAPTDIDPVGVSRCPTVSCRRKRLPTPEGEAQMPNLNINGRNMSVEAANDTPLLWVIREQLQMTGTKFGCGAALCGACTVHVDGEAVRSCSLALSAAAGHSVTTIEGLSADRQHPLQQAWIDEQVPQCGYCQSGMIMAAAALLAAIKRPSDADIDNAVTNICRCGTYARVRNAIHAAVART